MASIVNATATYLSTGNGYVTVYTGGRTYLRFNVSNYGGALWNYPNPYLNQFESYLVDNGNGTATIKGTFTTTAGQPVTQVSVALPDNIIPTRWVSFNSDNSNFPSGSYGGGWNDNGQINNNSYIISITNTGNITQSQVVNFNYVIGINYKNSILP